MKNSSTIFNCILFSLIFLSRLTAQTETESHPASKTSKWFASLQYMGLTFHPGGGSFPEAYPLKLDKKGYLVAQVGAAASIDYQLSNRFFLRGTLSGYMDCAYLPSGVVHLGFRWTPIKMGRHEFNGGFGPTFIIRGNWYRHIDKYRGGDFFDDRVTKDGKWQYRLVLYGGEFEYLYRINDKWQLQTSIIPGYPAVITTKIGVRVKL